jgi:hypothetical protein
MARAYGSSAHLLMKRETAYGQAASGKYLRMPFNRCNRGSEQGLIDDPVLGQGRDPLAPLQDVITDEGDMVVPVDPRYLGLWLTGLFGDPTTSIGQYMADRAVLRASVLRELKLEPDAGDPVAAHIMDHEPDQSDPDEIAHGRICG